MSQYYYKVANTFLEIYYVYSRSFASINIILDFTQLLWSLFIIVFYYFTK